MKSPNVAWKRNAMAASWMTSPALLPTMATPKTSSVSASATILMMSRVSRIAPACGTSALGALLIQLHEVEDILPDQAADGAGAIHAHGNRAGRARGIGGGVGNLPAFFLKG